MLKVDHGLDPQFSILFLTALTLFRDVNGVVILPSVIRIRRGETPKFRMFDAKVVSLSELFCQQFIWTGLPSIHYVYRETDDFHASSIMVMAMTGRRRGVGEKKSTVEQPDRAQYFTNRTVQHYLCILKPIVVENMSVSWSLWP